MSDIKLIGKEEAYKSISSQIDSGKLPHALMIVGDKGIGKKTFADAVCKRLFCESEADTCNSSCNACLKIEKGIHPDIFKIYPAGKSETIGVNEIAPIKKHLYIKPNDSAYKIFIIYNAERMNRFAQNAMLKMIEEPPEDSFFIFTCKNAQALLPTVRSRVTVLRLAPARLEDVKAELVRRFPEKPQNELSRAAELSCGNIGLAIELCEDSEIEKLYDDAANVAKAACDKDRALLCLYFGKYSKKKEMALRLVSLLKLIFRDISALKAGDDTSLSGCVDTVKSISAFLSGKSALAVMDACDAFVSAVEGNANLALSLTALEIRIGQAVKR
ncbi:MAG: hypothetical protein UHH95_04980 [Oscillospiraceae bacterium]|nr:hypothetical protein [Oscillospiraceae bacterium]